MNKLYISLDDEPLSGYLKGRKKCKKLNLIL